MHKVVADPADRAASTVEVLTDQGPERFDRVIIAAHSDQALEMLADPSASERAVLGSISYQANTATLHTDARLLPDRQLAHASWNYWIDPGGRRATVTYWMNALQAIASERPILLTLNRADAIDPKLVLAEFEYQHPVFDLATMRAQQRRREIQGTRGIYFVGAYWGYGFHEDGVQSALEVAPRSETNDERAVGGLCRHRAASSADARRARVLPAAVPRLSRCRCAARFARSAAGLVGSPHRAGAFPAPRFLRRAAGTSG